MALKSLYENEDNELAAKSFDIIKKINAKISRLNKYYNSPTELFARSFELYISDSELLKTRAPLVYKFYQKALENNKIPLISEFVTRASN